MSEKLGFLFKEICIKMSILLQPNTWWVSRQNQPMDYWGGSLPGSRKCECGLMGTCIDETKWCNCDAGKIYQF